MCLAMFHAASTGEVVTPEAGEDWLNRDFLAFSWRVNLESVTDIDANVCYPIVGVRIRSSEEHQVTRLKVGTTDANGRVVLHLRGARQCNAELAKDELH